MKLSEVPIGAHVRNPFTGTWCTVADVVRARDGSGNIRLTFANGDRLVAGPNEPVEIRVTDDCADIRSEQMEATDDEG